MTAGSRVGLKRYLQQMDEYEFERLVAGLWEEQGWQTQVTQKSDDKGKDVIAIKHDPVPHKQVIQVKRYQADNKVGRPAVQQYSSHLHEEDVDSVVIVTTSRFTSEAKRAARKYDVKLVDGEAICDLTEDVIEDEWFSQQNTGFSPQDFAEVDSIRDHTAYPTQKDPVSRVSNTINSATDGSQESSATTDNQTNDDANDQTVSSDTTTATSSSSNSSSGFWDLVETGMMSLVITTIILIPRAMIELYLYGGQPFEPNTYIVPGWANVLFLLRVFAVISSTRHDKAKNQTKSQTNIKYATQIVGLFLFYYAIIVLPSAAWKVLTGFLTSL